MPSDDLQYMQRCFALAARAQYSARPNPMVGCVLVKDDQLIGEGWHQVYGQAHAEINALEAAGAQARGATLYVSLEPCSHWGKTGPCADRVIEAGVARVVFAMYDPNPLVAGRGISRLREAGIDVAGPVLEAEAAALNPGFIKRMQQSLPWLRCKMAMSLDGRTAMASGESQWITGEQARQDVQHWRARSDAIITGVGSVLMDNPGMNARLPVPDLVQPLRVIVDSSLRTPPSARILQLPGEVLIATALQGDELLSQGEALQAQGARLIAFPGDHGNVDLPALLRYLGQARPCNEVLLESGARLAGAMLEAGLVDELITYIAPKLLGSEARPLFALPGRTRMADSLKLEITDVAMLGKDCRMRAKVSGPGVPGTI